jgi:nitroreductase/dihydropteridine reductase
MNQTLEALNWRYAVKKFSNKKLPNEKVDIVFEALRLTASSMGLQAWKFINVENPKIREKLVEFSWDQNQVKDASHLIVFARPHILNSSDVSKWVNHLAKERKMESHKKDRFQNMITNYLKTLSQDQLNHWLDKQIYIALGNLMTVCAYEKIDSCPMEGFNSKEYDRILGLNEIGLTSVVVCPIGYRAEDDVYRTQPKVRFEKEELFVEI